MAVRIGINGFGRIGRQVTKAICERYPEDIEIVAINDLTDNDSLAHLLKYDSIYGKFPGTVELSGDEMVINGKTIKCLEDRDPANLGWGDLGVDIVLESTGYFAASDKASAHIEAGAKKVIISAPAKTADCEWDDKMVTLVLGVNDGDYDPAQHCLISNASCTTNCLAPMAKVISDNWGIESGYMTTVHSYTNDQVILDFPHSDKRRMRAAAMNIIPTTTGAAKAVGLVLPEAKGKLDGYALRVPTPTGSCTDLTVQTSKPATAEEVNEALCAAASEGPMAPVLDYTDEPIVLQDIVGDPASCIVDGQVTSTLGSLVKVLGWYDNEWGYSNRAADLIVMLAAKGL